MPISFRCPTKIRMNKISSIKKSLSNPSNQPSKLSTQEVIPIDKTRQEVIPCFHLISALFIKQTHFYIISNL